MRLYRLHGRRALRFEYLNRARAISPAPLNWSSEIASTKVICSDFSVLAQALTNDATSQPIGTSIAFHLLQCMDVLVRSTPIRSVLAANEGQIMQRSPSASDDGASGRRDSAWPGHGVDVTSIRSIEQILITSNGGELIKSRDRAMAISRSDTVYCEYATQVCSDNRPWRGLGMGSESMSSVSLAKGLANGGRAFERPSIDNRARTSRTPLAARL